MANTTEKQRRGRKPKSAEMHAAAQVILALVQAGAKVPGGVLLELRQAALDHAESLASQRDPALRGQMNALYESVDAMGGVPMAAAVRMPSEERLGEAVQA